MKHPLPNVSFSWRAPAEWWFWRPVTSYFVTALFTLLQAAYCSSQRLSAVDLVVNSSLINSFIYLFFYDLIWLKLNFNLDEHSYLIVSFTLDLPWRENYAPLSLFSWSHIQSEEKITSSPYFRNTKNKILHMAANTVHNVKTFFKEILFIFEFFRHSRGFYLCQSGVLNQNFLHRYSVLWCNKRNVAACKIHVSFKSFRIWKHSNIELFLLEFKATNHFDICFCGLIEIFQFLVLSFYLLINIYCETLQGEIPLKMIRFTRYIN